MLAPHLTVLFVVCQAFFMPRLGVSWTGISFVNSGLAGVGRQGSGGGTGESNRIWTV